MKGFKNTTRTQYSMGGDVGGYAKGGMAKGAAKISKVMGEFKKGELHSGSKEGPKVTKPAQAKAIAMSEARKAGMKAPMKKNEGGKVGKMPPLGESVKSGNRMSKMTAAERLAMEARFGEKKRPSPADSVKSGNRIAKEEADEARAMGVFKDGGKVRKYAEGGAAKPFNPTQALNAFSADLARRVKAGTMTKQQAQQAQSQFRNQVQLNTKTPQTASSASAAAGHIMNSVMSPPNAGGVSAGHRDLGQKLQAQIKAGLLTAAQARDILNSNSPALRQLEEMKAKSRAAAQAPTPMRQPEMPERPPMMQPPMMQPEMPGRPVMPTRPMPPIKMYVDPYLPDRAPRQPVMPTPVMPMGVMPDRAAPMYGDGPLRPTTAQLSEYNAGGGKGAWDPVRGVFTASPPMPQMQTPLPTPMPRPMPTPMQPPMAQPPAIDPFAPVTRPPPMPGFRMGGMAKRRPC